MNFHIVGCVKNLLQPSSRAKDWDIGYEISMLSLALVLVAC